MADHNDRTQIPGQRQQSPAADNDQLRNFPPPPPMEPFEEKEPRLAALREWWNDAWDDGGVLHDRWEDLRQAPALGWHHMANWLKAVLAVAGASFVVLLLNGAAGVLADAVHRLLTAAPRVQVDTDTSTGVWAVVDQPIRSYIAQHSAGLAVSGSTIYTLWQVAGLFGLIGGFFRSTAARLTWTCWGAGSVTMIWYATPDNSRTVATGIAVLAWTLGSAFALRGLNLRPRVFAHIHNAAPEFRPEIHIPAQPAPPADDTPDNVHPLTKR